MPAYPAHPAPPLLGAVLHPDDFKRSALLPLSCRQLVGAVYLGSRLCLRRARDLHGTFRSDDFLCFFARRVCDVSLVLQLAEAGKRYIGNLIVMHTVFNRRFQSVC